MNDRAPREQLSHCLRVQGHLDELLDRGLEPLDAARDEGHLEACIECAAERDRRIEDLATLRSAFLASEGDLAHAQAGLSARLASAQPPAPRRSVHWVRPARAAAIAASALIALLALQRSGVLDVSLDRLFGSGLHSAPRSVFPHASWPADLPGPFGGD